MNHVFAAFVAEITNFKANNADKDQVLHAATLDQSLFCLSGPISGRQMLMG